MPDAVFASMRTIAGFFLLEYFGFSTYIRIYFQSLTRVYVILNDAIPHDHWYEYTWMNSKDELIERWVNR